MEISVQLTFQLAVGIHMLGTLWDTAENQSVVVTMPLGMSETTTWLLRNHLS